jgi:hypothetical protein
MTILGPGGAGKSNRNDFVAGLSSFIPPFAKNAKDGHPAVCDGTKQKARTKANAGVLPLRQAQGQNDALWSEGSLKRWLLEGAGGEVALLGADMVAGVGGLEIDGAEGAVHLEVRRAVDEVVLAAQLFLDVAEADGYIL